MIAKLLWNSWIFCWVIWLALRFLFFKVGCVLIIPFWGKNRKSPLCPVRLRTPFNCSLLFLRGNAIFSKKLSNFSNDFKFSAVLGSSPVAIFLQLSNSGWSPSHLWNFVKLCHKDLKIGHIMIHYYDSNVWKG